MAPFTRRQIIALSLATLSSRLLLAWVLGVGGAPEVWEYDVIAANIVNGAGHVYERAGFVYVAYAPPLWSWVLAGLRVLGEGRLWPIQVVQGFFCFASAVVYGRLARNMALSEGIALLTAFLVALQPSLLYYSVVKSDPLPLNVLLLGLILQAGSALIEEPSRRRAAW